MSDMQEFQLDKDEESYCTSCGKQVTKEQAKNVQEDDDENDKS